MGFREQGWGYNRIAMWLNQQGHKTTRGVAFRSAHVHSILKKKRIRDERFNQEPEVSIMDVDLYYSEQ